jgi:hypothetical protein
VNEKQGLFMANPCYEKLIALLTSNYGELKRMGNGYTLYNASSVDAIFYFRYSKTTPSNKNALTAFYGLRKEDLRLMQGKKSFICFLTDDENKSVFIPFQNYESFFFETSPAGDGQYKTNIFFKQTSSEIYFAGIGKFNADSYANINSILNISKTKIIIPELSHSQIQSLLGSIGIQKGFKIWFPESDKLKIDNSIVESSKIIEKLPAFGKEIDHIISEIDVIWFEQSVPVSFYEVEHSTPIYSGLLRFNDVLLTVAKTENFNIVANNERENKFIREVNRPTFKQNRLIESLLQN